MPDSGTNVSTSSKLLATGLALAVTLVICATAATVMASSAISKKAERVAPPLDITALERGTFRDRGQTAALIDSLLTPLGPLTAASPDIVAEVTALIADDAGPADVWEPVRSDISLPAKRTAVIPMLSIETALRGMSESQIAAAVADTASEGATIFRRWARSKPLPPLWGYRARFPGIANAVALSVRNPAYLWALFSTNDNAALLDLRAGNNSAAMERAREILAASRHLMEEPSSMDALMGIRFARRAAQLLAVAARRSDDRVTYLQAVRLDSLAAEAKSTSLSWVAQQESDPHSNAAHEVIANVNLMSGLRIEAMYPIMMGGCRNIREVVFGFSDARRVALVNAVEALRDIPRSDELVALYLKQFDEMMTTPELRVKRMRAIGNKKLRSATAMDWIVPPGVRARIALCSAWGD